MRLHEYEAKNIFANYGVPVPNRGLAKTAAEAVKKAKEMIARLKNKSKK